MKKLVSLLLALTLLCASLFIFASCGDEDATESKAYDKIIAEYKTEYDSSKEDLVVATSPDFAPMEFYDTAKGEIVGFDIILATYLAKELDMNLIISPMSFDACQAAVEAGTVDLALSGFSWMPERAENFELSNWYVAGDNETEQAIITTKANEGLWTTVEDFYGKNIAYQGSSLQEQLVKETFGENVTQCPYQDIGTAVEALKSGLVDAVAVAKGNGDSIIANASETIAFTGYEFTVAEIYKNNLALIQKGNTTLLNAVNAALDKALAADLYSTWYDACKVYAGISTADELGFDDDGNKITE